VYRNAEHGPEHPGGHHADPQPGVRAGADADRDGGEIGAGRARVGQHLRDHRREQLTMAPTVGGGRLSHDSLPVVQGHAHRRGRGIKTHHKHADQPSGRAA
jgi:hypothetical protein